jgi:SAM-dependent methyltransferase
MLSKNILQRIETQFRCSFGRLVSQTSDFSAIARDFVSELRAREELQRLAGILGGNLCGKKMLELGSGYGMLLAVARREFGIEAFGVEPAEQFEGTYTIGCEVLREMGVSEAIVKKGRAEEIPFENDGFDLIYSSNVLEHVHDPSRVFKESLRVVKPGGHIVAIIPNYGSWWEGHYGMIMPPGCPKWMLKIIVSLLGRDASFIDTLNFITYRKLRQWLKPIENEINVLEWGQSLWTERLRTLSFSEWAELGKLKKAVRLLHFLKLTELIVIMGKLFHWETPFFLVMRKKMDA